MEQKQRKVIRLRNYDYSDCGAYFVTICTHERKNLLSVIRRNDPCSSSYTAPTKLGLVAMDVLSFLENRYDIAIIDSVIMPDHIHMVLFLPDKADKNKKVPLSRIIGAFKSIVSNKWLETCKQQGAHMGKIWQSGYYEHVVRNNIDLQEIIEYIQGNPDRWWEKKNLH